MELRWDGVPSLADALRMLKAQAMRTPPGQWVRVVGGFSEFQFAERRMPTLDEINAVAPDTPVFILHLYCRALLNRAALRACGYTRDTPNPPGGEIERSKNGEPTGLLIARPNATILYSTLAKGPKLSSLHQENSTRHFMRELNRHWFFDHCETIGDKNLDRIKALGGGIAIQHRMAYQGEYFLARYGKVATRITPPFKKMLERDIPVGAGHRCNTRGKL
jgi:predicted amidohydrolase YtcJ